MIGFFKKVKKSFIAWISVAIIAFSIILIVVFRGWIAEQGRHILSFYYVAQGDQKYRKGNLQGAISDYNYALKLYPEHVRARYNLGNIYSSYEDFYSAIACYEKALSFNPYHLNSRMNLGLVYLEEIRDYDKAINEFDMATKSEPLVMKIPYIYDNGFLVKANIAVAYYNLGLSYKYKSLLVNTNRYLASKYLRIAAKNYKKSIEINPNVYESHHNYALALHLLGLQDEAMQEYCKAIRIEPLNYEAHYNLAVLLKDNKKFRESLDELEKTGLILDSRGDSDKLRYIFGAMIDIGQRITYKRDKYGHIINKFRKSPAQSYNITYLNGRVVVPDNMDEKIVDNFKKCDYCDKCSK